jgi:hypothetical protein
MTHTLKQLEAAADNIFGTEAQTIAEVIRTRLIAGVDSTMTVPNHVLVAIARGMQVECEDGESLTFEDEGAVVVVRIKKG